MRSIVGPTREPDDRLGPLGGESPSYLQRSAQSFVGPATLYAQYEVPPGGAQAPVAHSYLPVASERTPQESFRQIRWGASTP